MRVAVIGFGAIGAEVVAGLQSGAVPGAQLSGVVVRRPGSVGGIAPELTLEEAIAGSDLLVECAGQQAAASLAPRALAAGTDVLLVSIGALADQALREALTSTGPGRLHLSTGAIGGLDLLAAASAAGGVDRLSLTTTKLPRALVQEWMSEEETAALLSASEPTLVFEGSVADAAARFPASLNVAVALAAATGLYDAARVRLRADPDAPRTSHRIQASGTLGDYDLRIRNTPSPKNPASSGIVAHALLQGIRRLSGRGVHFV